MGGVSLSSAGPTRHHGLLGSVRPGVSEQGRCLLVWYPGCNERQGLICTIYIYIYDKALLVLGAVGYVRLFGSGRPGCVVQATRYLGYSSCWDCQFMPIS